MSSATRLRPVAHLEREHSELVKPGVRRQAQLPKINDSPLSLAALFFDPGSSYAISGDDEDAIIFVQSGVVFAQERTELTSQELGRGAAAQVTKGTTILLTAGAEGAQIFCFTIERTADEHAPMGDASRYQQVDFSELDAATSNRSFQILFGPQNGSLYATFFVGIVPPGAAPWHFHQYDEIVLLHEGEITFHQPTLSVSGEVGTAFRIQPRDLHINENTSATMDAIELGIFTPAGSPSAAYLPATQR